MYRRVEVESGAGGWSHMVRAGTFFRAQIVDDLTSTTFSVILVFAPWEQVHEPTVLSVAFRIRPKMHI